jgi:two-component system, OmpR family, sensor kinase
MAASSRSAGLGQSLRYLPKRMALRTKLIAVVLALVAIALVVISVAGLGFLRSYLLGEADDQLATLQVEAHYGHLGAQQYGPEAWVAEGVSDGRVVVSNAGGYAPGETISLPQTGGNPAWLSTRTPVTVRSQDGSTLWRVLAQPNQSIEVSPGQVVEGTLVVGVDVTSQYNTIAKLTLVDILVSLIILIALGAVGTGVVRASLRPLTEIEQTAGAIAAGDLTRRVPERDPRTEVGRLGRSLNIMLSQIETAFRARSQSESAARRSEERMRQFVADASHELRTPLTAIRGFAEYYRQRGGIADSPVADAPIPQAVLDEAAAAVGRNGTGKLSPADLDRIMRRVEQESARMGVLVEDMLLLARMDQQRPLDFGPVDLLTLAADAVHDARVVAPKRSINLTVGAGAALLVNGDEVRLRQVIGNLMSNALAHTPAGSPIDVRIRSGSLTEVQAADAAPEFSYEVGANAVKAATHAAAILEVTDHGPGLTKEQAEHAFERFYRADQARTPGGTGLGLAIVAALVAAHGGAVWVRSEPGEGATFSIALPLTPEALAEADDQATEPDDETGADMVADDAAWHNAA